MQDSAHGNAAPGGNTGHMPRIAPEKITLDAQIKRDLHADSLDILQLLMRLEDDYGVVIPDQALAKFETVGDVVSYLDSLEK